LAEPTANVEIVNLAFPPLSCAVPNTFTPTMNVTGPVGMTVGDLIAAVNVTASPLLEGFGDDVRPAELVVCFTTWFTMGDALGPLFSSPKYTVVSGYESLFKFDLFSVATPLTLSIAVPKIVLPDMKLTFPVGMVGPTVVTTDVQVIF
jgi:hypothetical protein